MEPLRQAILHRDETFKVPVIRRSNFDRADRRLVVLREPAWLHGAIAVVIGDHMIILPPADGPSDVLERFSELDPGVEVLLVPHVEIPWPTQPLHRLDRYRIDEIATAQ
jgi:hypothetical protein